jgi:predicted ester cyclase
MSEENKAAFLAVTDTIVNNRDLAAVEQVFAPAFVDRAAPEGSPSGHAAIKGYYTMLFAAFPDFHYTVEDLMAVGDKVVGRCTASGTMQGQYLGLKPTGKKATWTEIHIGRFANGQWVEHWATSDQLDMLLQLGAIPPLGR